MSVWQAVGPGFKPLRDLFFAAMKMFLRCTLSDLNCAKLSFESNSSDVVDLRFVHKAGSRKKTNSKKFLSKCFKTLVNNEGVVLSINGFLRIGLIKSWIDHVLAMKTTLKRC